MGLIVDIYRNADRYTDCTNGGISSKVTQLCVINVDGPFEPTDNAPAVKLLPGPFNSVRLVPAELADSYGVGVMYGGNFASTSDSRFGQAIAKLTEQRHADGVVKIFDRVETAEQMRVLSI